MNDKEALKRGVERNRGIHGPLSRLCLTLFFNAVLVSCTGRGMQPTATQAVLDSADQVLIGMTHYVTQAGLQRARVRADTAFFFSNTQTAELRKVHVTFYDARGAETSTLTAREGTYHWRTQDMEGRGNVVVVRNSDGGTLHTEAMRYSQTRNEVTSDVAFTFDSPTQHLKGVGFTADPDFRNVATKQLTGTGGQLVLPRK
ncbi:MAG TPA: LPS export ABC transporter periplasmic protein LptC [Gemmatimonadales bacterium]|jgi:LPS export ABC transporter protein LptC|nr:LPS export ABC transporter periplasmic protein LptC [Gemmatimonadales bacterium]